MGTGPSPGPSFGSGPVPPPSPGQAPLGGQAPIPGPPPPAGSPGCSPLTLLVVGLTVGFLALVAIAGGLLLTRSGDGTDEAGGGNRYPADVRSNFLDACENAGSSRSTCACILEALEDTYTLSEFTRLEEEILRGGTSSGAIREMEMAAAACI